MSPEQDDPGHDTDDASEGNHIASNDPEAPTPVELTERIPPEAVGPVSRVIGASISMVGSAANPLLERITSDHITEIIAHRGRQSDRAYSDRKHSRLVSVFFAVFVIAMFVGLCVTLLLLDATDLLRDLLIGLGIFGGGYGLGRFQR